MSSFQLNDRVEATYCQDEQEHLNGKRGTIKTIPDDISTASAFDSYGVLFDDEKDIQHLAAVQLFLFQNEEDSFQQQMKRAGPDSLLTLVTKTSFNPFLIALYHRAARKLESWCSEEEIEQFLADETTLHRLTTHVLDRLIFIYTWIMDQQNFAEKVFSNEGFCSECICVKEESASRAKILVPFEATIQQGTGLRTVELALGIHFSSVVMEVMSKLLIRPSSDHLLNRLTIKDFQGKSTIDAPIHHLLQFMFFARSLPTATEAATEVVARIMVTKPLAVLSVFTADAALFTHTDTTCVRNIRYRLESVGIWTNDILHLHLANGGGTGTPAARISDEMKEGMVHAAKCLIDLLPILYHLGSWRQCHSLTEYQMLAHSIVVVLNQVLQLTVAYPFIVDVPVDTSKYPRVRKSVVFADPLLLDESTRANTWRKDLLVQRPGSFAVTGLIEVLAWWVFKGFDLHIYVYPTHGPDSTLLRRSISLLRSLVMRNTRLSHVQQLASSLADMNIPEAPTQSTYLLYGPLFFAHRRCGLLGCDRTTSPTGGALLRCSGGCDGLEQYCCREHQLADWKAGHKNFCKRNGKAKKS